MILSSGVCLYIFCNYDLLKLYIFTKVNWDDSNPPYSVYIVIKYHWFKSINTLLLPESLVVNYAVFWNGICTLHICLNLKLKATFQYSKYVQRSSSRCSHRVISSLRHNHLQSESVNVLNVWTFCWRFILWHFTCKKFFISKI